MPRAWTGPSSHATRPTIPPELGHVDRLTATRGERVEFSAEGSTDPDGDALSHERFYYNESGTFPASTARTGQSVSIQDFDQSRAWFTVPTRRVMPPGLGTLHVVLAVTDHGTPRLTRYRRVIVEVTR